MTYRILTKVWLAAGATGLESQSGSMHDPTFALMLYFVHSYELTVFPTIGLISRIGLHFYKNRLSQHSPSSSRFVLPVVSNSEAKRMSKMAANVNLEVSF